MWMGPAVHPFYSEEMPRICLKTCLSFPNLSGQSEKRHQVSQRSPASLADITTVEAVLLLKIKADLYY